MSDENPELGCNGICLTPGDIGLPEYDAPGVVAYAHPDCPEHGDPLDYGTDPETCAPGEDESQRFVREEDVTP